MMSKKAKIVDLDKIPEVNSIKISVDGKELPIAIGDKLRFPDNDMYLKTVVAIQVNEDGVVNYMLEWFEDSIFKQNTVSMTELKMLKQNLIERKIVKLFQDQVEKEQTKKEIKEKKVSKK